MSIKSDNNLLAKQVRQFRVCSSVTDSAIRHFFSALDTPRSLAAWLLYESGDHQQLVELEVNPLHYNDAEKFRDDYVATNFLAKADFLKLDISKKDAAMVKFHKFEELCRETNRRFESPALDPKNIGPNVWLLNATKRKIEGILGEFTA